jgi:hypothetical protein
MTLREGAVISAYTGVLCCQSFQLVHEYIEELMERAVLTHEIPELAEEIKKRSKREFDEIIKGQGITVN